MNFIYCLDEDLKNKLIKQGFKMLKEDDNGAFFVFKKSDEVKFDFSNVDKTKFLFTNRLTF